MIISILCVVGLLVVGFVEYYICMKFAAQISTRDKSYSLSDRKIKDAHEAFTKGNYLSKYVDKGDDKKMTNVIRARRVLTIAFIVSFFF
jgi:hypothetical protein